MTVGGWGGAGVGDARGATQQAQGLPSDCTRSKHQQAATAAATAAALIDHVYHSGAPVTTSHLSGGFAYF